MLSHTPDELREAFASSGIEGYRADQVARWVYARGQRDFERMTDLPRDCRARLQGEWRATALDCRVRHAADDRTQKLELVTADGARIEAVVIPEGRRQTICVSSQIGCSLDCAFCATGRLGLGRNLSPEEIVDQVAIARDLLAEQGAAPTHVVFMGMGEPLLNLRSVLQALRVLTHPRGLGLSPRRITVSTAGVVPQMAPLVKAIPVRLAVSLHATTDEVRDQLVPLNRRFPIGRLLQTCAELPISRRDLLTFEYTLLRDVNDTDDDARRLARLLRPLRAKVNLIPMNEFPGSSYGRPDAGRIDRFAALVSTGGVTLTVRRPRGDDIYAACGQLGRLAPPSSGPEKIQQSVR